ncbi:cytochrome P450 [Kitasatospora sp. NBC_01287]|uniref:cytochrome P450 family protein n=1 Tax=Kitasatospora sp. NBC_01287 TaxID=2903573 RepID=UPI00224CDE76|nr:cytochrome P450 [Kitasatospora sp. NBC_01287]MCX4745973.1 cytochrome P450 [Kitasatospora sp. NBC_01287]
MAGSTGAAAVVTGYEQARLALSTSSLSKDASAFFADHPSDRSLHPAVARNMLTSDPPAHTRLRRLVVRAFTSSAVDSLRPCIRSLTEQLIERWEPRGEVDLIADLAGPLPVTVICQLLGVPPEDWARIRRLSTDLFATGDHTRIDAASHALADYMTRLIATKRAQPDKALLSSLIAVRDADGDRLSEEELLSLGLLLLIAGHETTTAAIGNAVLALLQHPAELEHLRSHPNRIPTAVDELLRYDSPVSIATWRHAARTVQLGDTEVAAGTAVFVAPGAANRDPGKFTDPDRLDLQRQDAAQHLAFGHGMHRCLGAPLAHAEIETTLRVLLKDFPGMRLAVPAEELQWRHSRLIRGLESLPVLL